MKNYFRPFILGSVILLALGACSKEVLDDSLSQAKPTSTLSVVTRSGDSNSGNEGGDISSGRIYIFKDNSCVSVLTVSDGETTSAAQLAAGNYTVYAVGGVDMSRFTLPEQEDANAKSEIGLVSGLQMDDLLMVNTSLELEDGEERQLNLTLERKVMRIDQATIKNVPEGVTKVEVLLEPLYQKVCLDGTYPDETGRVKVSLTKDTESTEGLWALSSSQYCFPASGTPVITVRFTTATETKNYSYTVTQSLPANHKLKIDGTYTEAQGVALTGILTSTGWGEDITITFDFDENNATTSGNDNNDEPAAGAPVQGSTYLGCYVVSVDQDNKTAVLLSPTKQGKYSVDPDNQALSKQILEEALDSWPSVSGVSGVWRIPTLAEAQVFLADVAATGTINSTQGFFCYEGTVLKKLFVQTVSGVNSVTGPFTNIAKDTDYLRPVIDVEYQ